MKSSGRHPAKIPPTGMRTADSVQFFALQVGNRQSIGPQALRTLWATACESLDVCVERRFYNAAGGRVISYSLCARELRDRAHVEARLRTLLERGGYVFTLRSVTH